MPKYLYQGSYTVDGVQGLLSDGGTKRRQVVADLISGMGGTLEAFYYAFGENDFYIILDMPDSASGTALALAVASSGAVSGSITVLITPEEVDEATRKTVNYRPPAIRYRMMSRPPTRQAQALPAHGRVFAMKGDIR